MPSNPPSTLRFAARVSVVMVWGMLGFACASDDGSASTLISAETVGAGGSSATLAPGAPNAAPGTPSAELLECGLGAGELDQMQARSDGNIAVTSSQLPGQSFTLRTSGVLAGLEFGLSNCNGTEPGARIQLTLSRAGTVIATAGIPAERLANEQCDAIALDEHAVGAGFFDFTGQCVSVNAGETLTATLSVSAASGICNERRRCVGGVNDGHSCRGADDCEYSARVGERGAAEQAGGEVVNGETDASFDLAFKVFVR